MAEPFKTKPQWIRDTGLIAVALPPPPVMQKFSGGQRGDADANYELKFSDAALDSLVRAGVTLVYVRFFAGFGLEFEKNEIERLRDYFARARNRGIKTGARIALGTLKPEALLVEETDAQNWLQLNGDGRTIVPDTAPRPVLNAARPCYNSEGFLRYIERVCAAAVDCGADLVHFDSGGFNLEPDTCRCPICVGLFREFLRHQYGTQEERTRVAGRERFGHNSFIHTRPPAYNIATATSGEPIDAPHEQEWQRFKAHTFAQCIARLARAVSKRNPNCAVSAEMLSPTPGAEAAHALSAVQLLPQLDAAGIAHRTDVLEDRPLEPISVEASPPEALHDPRSTYEAKDADELAVSEAVDESFQQVAQAHCAAIRSFKRARAFGAVCIDPQASLTALEPAALETALDLQLAFNPAGLGVIGDALSPWFGPGWEHRVESDAGLKTLRAHVDFYARFKQSLLLDGRSLATLAVLRDPPSLSFDQASAAAQTAFEDLLIENNVPFDIIYPRHLEDLSRYRAVALAGCEALSDGIIRQLERFVGSGGGVFALGNSGRRDDWRRVRPQPGLAALLGDEYPKALRRQIGSGRAAYLPSVDSEDSGALIEALEFAAGAALPVKVECASGLAIVECAATRSGALAIHALNPHAAPASGLRVSVACEQAPKQAVLHRPSVNDEDIVLSWDNGRAHAQIGDLACYGLIEVRF